ncbi:DUF397 domain-containing protein [Actinophytocola sediminis]
MQSRTPSESEFTGWHKPEASQAQGNGCVEVGYAPGHVAVRDTKNPGKPAHIYTALEWNLFLDAVVNGEYQHN